MTENHPSRLGRTEALLERIAEALERRSLVPSPPFADLAAADAFVWTAEPWRLEPVPHVDRIPLELLKGIEDQRDRLLANTRRFARGLPANNALLWGARGMGKSSLVKAVHGAVNAGAGRRRAMARLALIEIHREDIATLPLLLGLLGKAGRKCLLFCDDLSFEGEDQGYKSLKSVLDGGIAGRPAHVLFYATSNRRHLLAADQDGSSSRVDPHAVESVNEKIALSDRFGLWIGFHPCDQETFFAMVRAYAAHFRLPIDDQALLAGAVEWSVTRGARSGRVAWQYVVETAGRLGRRFESPGPA